MPAGIDCQRCHGPGSRHMQAAHKATPMMAEIRAGIVNPARLSKERQMEVCLQCHLETTSAPLPASIRRFDKGPFSYLPGQPLSNFILSFDQAPGHGRQDRFEIAGAAYRFRQSQCFLQSHGALTCQTCHNPHDIPRGAGRRHLLRPHLLPNATPLPWRASLQTADILPAPIALVATCPSAEPMTPSTS